MHFVPKTASGIFFGIAFVFEEPKQREIETERGERDRWSDQVLSVGLYIRPERESVLQASG